MYYPGNLYTEINKLLVVVTVWDLIPTFDVTDTELQYMLV
jgi:hypothetical protein